MFEVRSQEGWITLLDAVSVAGSASTSAGVPIIQLDERTVASLGCQLNISVTTAGSTDSLKMEVFAGRDKDTIDSKPFSTETFPTGDFPLKLQRFYDYQQTGEAMFVQFTRLGATDTFVVTLQYKRIAMQS